jgi:ATP-dependent RNA helicase HelY
VEEEAVCEYGDVGEYRELAKTTAPRRVRRQRLEQGLARLRPGDVISTDEEPRVAVLSVAFRKGGALRIKAVTPSRHVEMLGMPDFDEPPHVLGTIDLPEPYLPDDSDFRAQVAARLSRIRVGKRPVQDTTTEAVDHPVAACPDADAHVRALDRADRLRREVGELERRIASQTGTIGLQFEQVLDLLADWGYVDDWTVTERGALLAGVYHEADLVVAEAIASGCFDGLDAPELAAVASVLVYEHRAPGPPPTPHYPSRRVRERANEIDGIVRRLQSDEDLAGLPLTRGGDHGFARLAHEWCAGVGLGPLLVDGDLDLTGGDFVRTIRQLIDLVRQIGQLAPDDVTRATARRATGALERGVVSASAALESAEADDDDPQG